MRPFAFEEYCFFSFTEVYHKQVYFYKCYKVSIFQAFDDIDFWKCLPNFLFRNWTLSLLLKKSKVGSVMSFPVWFHLILFLSLINCIINQFSLLIALILITELEGLFIYKYMVFSDALFFPRNLVLKSEEIDLHVHGKKFHLVCFWINGILSSGRKFP